MNYATYVLRSSKDDSLYIGMTSKDPRVRLLEHNKGKTKYTKGHRPYQLIYYELGFCNRCAREREKFLKSGQGRKILRIIINSNLGQ